ncbi:uncharacterized protein FPRO_01511 [Fusarium proliferatum ET1]|uniref:DUF7918 domain-containing protein n=1 Tax=Fusarium proliferatum (strain ET1) TaxID=1227346 RepID=A0A1L7V098_FUSPR|nr:uncharacterized protein FPRO_01511 [Fusarium proliferatum ET1]CZR33939.1 uncharacterized protein FPRO_01511 [Fusarium proliferatum ET1]
MAVLDEVPHVTARVRVAGELATEYDPLDDEEAVVKLDKEGTKIPRKVCYIESKSGAEFAIEIVVSDKYQPPNSHDSFIAEVYVDGERRRCKILDVPLSSSRKKAIIISSGRVSPETRAKKPILGKFVFAPINTISDPTSADRLNQDLKRAETLGIIRLCLFAGRFKGTRPREHHSCYSTSREVEVAEKALKGKAISHTTTLAETTEKPSSQKTVTTDDRLMGEIFFRYRSYQALQHEMIIPRTPSPEPSATTSIDASALSLLTESDIRRLALERLRDTQIKNESSHVKREAEEASQSPRRWKFVRLEDGKEAVDLTDD